MSKNHRKYVEILKRLYAVRVDSRPLVELFYDVPNQEEYPDYREYVDTPISLTEISKRARLDAYDSDEDFIADFDLMMDNARAYNGESNVVVDDALDILDFVLVSLSRNLNRTTRLRQQEQVLKDLENYKTKGRRPAENFEEVPDRNEYPDYYQVIENPTSLNKVRQTLEENGPCETWEDFKAMTEVIFKNAMTYNAPDSMLYADAQQLMGQLSKKISKNRQVPKFLLDAARDFGGGGVGVLKIRGGRSGRSGPSTGSDSDGDDSDRDEDEEDDDEEIPEPRLVDDDDDEDFQADSDELEDDEMPDMDVFEGEDSEIDLDQSRSGTDGGMQGPGFGMQMQPVHIYDEITYRDPSSRPGDAMIQLVTLTTYAPPSHNRRLQIVPLQAKDILQIRVPAARKELFTTYSTTLAGHQSSLKLVVFLNDALKTVPMELTAVLNGRKLMSAPVPPQASVLYEEFDLQLAPGLNQVTLAAIRANSSGFVRPMGPPPIIGSEPDEERMVLFLNLTR